MVEKRVQVKVAKTKRQTSSLEESLTAITKVANVVLKRREEYYAAKKIFDHMLNTEAKEISKQEDGIMLMFKQHIKLLPKQKDFIDLMARKVDYNGASFLSKADTVEDLLCRLLLGVLLKKECLVEFESLNFIPTAKLEKSVNDRLKYLQESLASAGFKGSLSFGIDEKKETEMFF